MFLDDWGLGSIEDLRSVSITTLYDMLEQVSSVSDNSVAVSIGGDEFLYCDLNKALEKLIIHKLKEL